jgi:TM2 domain-containing membrane protein YozV
MKCANHARTDAAASCAGCGKPICRECAVVLSARTGEPTSELSWCHECLSKAVQKRHRSRIVAALLSIIPGAGHMYLGLIGKGFALMGLLIASIFLIILYSDSTGMYWMTAYLIPTLSVLFLSYAIFDSLNASGEDDVMKTIWETVLLNRRAAGYVVLVAGLVGVLNLLDASLGRLVREWLSLEVPITAFVIPIVLVIVGIFLLRKGKRAR